MADPAVYSQLGVGCIRVYLSPWVWILHAQQRCSSLVNLEDWAAHLPLSSCQRRDVS